MIPDLLRDLLMSFPLITYVDEAMVYSHFEFCWGLVAATLVFIELFQTSECCNPNCKRARSGAFEMWEVHTVHELLLFERD